MAHYLVPTQEERESKELYFLEHSKISFLSSAASALGRVFTRDAAQIPYGRDDLRDLFILYSKLKKRGVIQNLSRVRHIADEPRYHSWSASYDENDRAGGLSIESDRTALTATLAESVERYIWRNDIECLRTLSGTEREVGVAAVPIASIVANSTPPEIALYQWVRGYSLVTKRTRYIPAQLISSAYSYQLRDVQEPMLRENTTTGLATGPSHDSANLSGLLEVIERDSFMIMWLNQLSVPIIKNESLTSSSKGLATLMERCSRYNLQVSFLQCTTDAPTFVIGAVVHDPAQQPPYTIGMCAHPHSHYAAEKALLEALRARVNARSRKAMSPEPFNKSGTDIRHLDRSLYWMDPERGKLLSFLTAGPTVDAPSRPWGHDTPQEHLIRLIEWCRSKNYECVSVDMSGSAYNVTPWYVHFVAVPQLQPMYQNEKRRIGHGRRLTDVPRELGFTPRDTPYFDHPHPFV